MKHPAALPALLLSVPCAALVVLALAAPSHPDLYSVLPWAGPLLCVSGFVAAMMAVAGPLAQLADTQDELLDIGLPAMGVVRAVESVGVWVNKRPLLQVTVEVLDGLAPTTAHTKVFLPPHRRLEPGDTVPLRVHPEHPDQVALAGF